MHAYVQYNNISVVVNMGSVHTSPREQDQLPVLIIGAGMSDGCFYDFLLSYDGPGHGSCLS